MNPESPYASVDRVDAEAAWDIRERLHRAGAAVSVLRQVGRLVEGIHGRRKALIYIGEGIDIDVGPGGGPQQEVTDGMHDFIATAARSNLHVYAIDPRGFAGAEARADRSGPGDLDYHRVLEREVQASVDSLRAWAEETGGVSIVQTNDLESALERIAAENSHYYALGYSSGKSDDGRFHRIEIRVKRPGVTVRARRGFVASSGGRDPAPGTARTSAPTALDEAMSLPVEEDGIHLQAAAAPFFGNDGRMDVVMTVLAGGVGVDALGENLEAAGGELAFRLRAVGSDGKLAAARKGSALIRVGGGTPARSQTPSLSLLDHMELTAGTYRVGVGAAGAASTRVGTLQFDLDVPDLRAGSMSVGGPLVSSARTPPGPSTALSERFREWLPNGPTAQRRFSHDDEVVVFFEIYKNRPVESILVNAVVTEEGGGVVLQQSTPVRPENGVARRPYVAHVPLKDLDPGRYRLRFEFVSPGSEPVVRQVVFQVDAS